MPGSPPSALARLLDASDEAAREAAWSQLVVSVSRLLLHVARSFGGDHDATMDRYTAVLEGLRHFGD